MRPNRPCRLWTTTSVRRFRRIEHDGRRDARRARPAGKRGRAAEAPQEIPKLGWHDVLLRSLSALASQHLSLIAAGVAFYSLLALFPGIAALIAIWSLIFDPAEIGRQIAAVGGLLPGDAAAIITDQADKVAGEAGALTLAAVFGLLIALYSSGAAVRALIEGLNIVYMETEKRGFVRLYLTSFAMTIGFIVMLLLALAVIAGIPAALAWLGLDTFSERLISILRWPLLFVVAAMGLATLYRHAPSRDRAQ